MRARTSDSPKEREKWLSAFEQNLCRFHVTCKELGVDAEIVNDWRKMYPEFEKGINERRKRLAEAVEGGLLQQALDPGGPPVSKIFFLKFNWKEKYGDREQFIEAPPQLWFQKPEVKELPEAKKEETDVPSGNIHPEIVAGTDSGKPPEGDS